jgi:hypothetical protein
VLLSCWSFSQRARGFLVVMYLAAYVYAFGRTYSNQFRQRCSRERNAGGVMGLLHEEAKVSSQMRRNKSNREVQGEKEAGK